LVIDTTAGCRLALQIFAVGIMLENVRPIGLPFNLKRTAVHSSCEYDSTRRTITGNHALPHTLWAIGKEEVSAVAMSGDQFEYIVIHLPGRDVARATMGCQLRVRHNEKPQYMAGIAWVCT